MNSTDTQHNADKEIDLHVFIDESGSITKTNVLNNKYFLISMIITNDKNAAIKRFKKSNARLAKKDDSYAKQLKTNKEIKGSDIKETNKKEMYESFVKHERDKLEIGVIVLDNIKTKDKLCNSKARCFNYIIQEYINNTFRKHSKYNNIRNINFIIDERSVKKEAKSHLQEYLLQHLNTFCPICSGVINVCYVDSKKYELVQLADYVANTFYRSLFNSKESIDNKKILSTMLCNGDVLNFPIENKADE